MEVPNELPLEDLLPKDFPKELLPLERLGEKLREDEPLPKDLLNDPLLPLLRPDRPEENPREELRPDEKPRGAKLFDEELRPDPNDLERPDEPELPREREKPLREPPLSARRGSEQKLRVSNKVRQKVTALTGLDNESIVRMKPSVRKRPRDEKGR